AGVYIYGLPESPVGLFSLEDAKICFSPAAKAGSPAMLDGAGLLQGQAVFAVNVDCLRFENTEFEKAQGELMELENVGSLEASGLKGK
ncbi:MAG: hypothetical protein LBT59_04020, partial [Clostridiales bacterium]|nr:hypothetical protein [Clostridiales bacterium]